MYVNKFTVAAFAAVVSLPFSFTQVTTTCQPLNGTCPPEQGLATSSYFVDFTKDHALPADWSVAAYENVEFGPNGAELTFAKRYDAPLIRTNFNFLFGRIDYVVQTAPGVGIASCMVLLSSDLDEIDWEFLGGAGNSAETNYWGKGQLDYGVARYIGVNNPTTQFHTYSIDWSPSSLSWIIDGNIVRTVTAAEGGNIYPQTPMKVSLSLWDGGDPSEPAGTRAWAGGITPIPPPENYTMFIKSVSIHNANPAEQYEYTDKSGSWQSIKMLNSTAPIVSSSSSPSVRPTSISTNPSAPFVLPTTTPASGIIATQSPITIPTTRSISATLATSASLMNTKAVDNPNLATSLSISATSLLSSVASMASSVSSIINTKATVTPPTSISGSLVPVPVVTPLTSVSGSLVPVPLSSSGSFSSLSLSVLRVPTSPTSQDKIVSGSTTPMTSISGSLVPLSTVTPLTSISGSLVPVPIPSSLSTQATVTTQIVHTTTTLCPVTNTITSNGTPTLQVTTAISTIFSTSTSIICTKCIAPMLSTAKKAGAGPSSSPTAVSSYMPGSSGNSGSANLSSSSSLLASALAQSSMSGVSRAPSSPLVPGSSAVLASGSTGVLSPPAASSPALTQLGSSIRASGPLPGITQAVVTSDIVYSTLTTYPVTKTITPLGGLPTQQVTSTVSTVRSTSISTVCTNCVAPIVPTPGSPAQHGAATSPASALSESQLAMSIAMSATEKAISESQVAISTLLQALTVASADASIASHLYYYSSQLDVIANPTATNKPTGTSVQVSYITRIDTQAAATSTTVNTAIIPAGIFTPIAHSEASASASGSGSGALTSSITVGQTSTTTSYQVGTSGTGSMDSGSNSTVAKPTQPAFHGAASNSFSFAGILASVIATVAMVICL